MAKQSPPEIQKYSFIFCEHGMECTAKFSYTVIKAFQLFKRETICWKKKMEGITKPKRL